MIELQTVILANEYLSLLTSFHLLSFLSQFYDRLVALNSDFVVSHCCTLGTAGKLF